MASRSRGTSARRLAAGTGYVLAVAAGTAIALTPSVLLFPQRASDDARIALVVLIIGGLLWWAWRRPAARRDILVWVGLGAGVTVATFLVVRLMPPELWLKVPTPDFLPRLLQVDGELADDTFLYELINETWLALAIVAFAGVWVLRRKEKAAKAV